MSTRTDQTSVPSTNDPLQSGQAVIARMGKIGADLKQISQQISAVYQEMGDFLPMLHGESLIKDAEVPADAKPTVE